ncbi:hypothetical protein MRA01_16820 [Methylobacterium radiotolerans]|nr:hypothetical protein MRA01_16820 [Methylobacterium radiotolerans]
MVSGAGVFERRKNIGILSGPARPVTRRGPGSAARNRVRTSRALTLVGFVAKLPFRGAIGAGRRAQPGGWQVAQKKVERLACTMRVIAPAHPGRLQGRPTRS